MSVAAFVLAELRPVAEEERDVGAEVRASSSSCSAAAVARASRSRAGAPSPRPSCRRRGRPRPGSASRSARASAARRRRRPPARSARRARACRPAKPSTWSSADASSSAIRSQSATRCRTVVTSCFPSGRRGPTTSARLIFAVAGARLTQRARRARRTPPARAPARVRPARADRGERRPRLRAWRGRRARASSRASCAGARTRGDDGLDSPEVVGQRLARERDERGVDVRARPEHVARDGMEARALRGEADVDRHGAVRLRALGAAKKRSATSRCTITHQRSIVGRPSSLSATSGVAMLYGRFATSLVGGGSSDR